MTKHGCHAILCAFSRSLIVMKGAFLRNIIILSIAVLACGTGQAVAAGGNNQDLLNRPYADLKRLHFGFSVGMHFQDLMLKNNGFITDAGEAWVAEVPAHSPGFCVNVLADLRLSQYFNLRLSPGMYFGNKRVTFLDTNSGTEETQNIRSNYVVVPLDLKYSALRYKNLRPYLVGGVMGVFDVAKKRSEQLRLTSADLMLTIGFGCDFYLPFFKLCPEVKFCFGLRDLLDHVRDDLSDDPEMMKYTRSIDRGRSRMVVVTFYFE